MVEPQTVMDSYLPIFVLFVLGVLFAALSFLASALLAPRKRPTAAKVAPYECGIIPDREPPQRFPVRFYLVAILFIIFDLEVAFLFPWAITLGATRLFGFLSMMGFLGVLTAGFIYEWCKGALEWE